MKKQPIIELLAQALEVNVEDLTNNTSASLESFDWNSITLINFMAGIDEHFNIVLSPPMLLKCVTVEDILNMVIQTKMNSDIAVSN